MQVLCDACWWCRIGESDCPFCKGTNCAPQEPQQKEVPYEIHDYTYRGWGHDFTYSPRENGKQASMIGWGYGLKLDDLIKIPCETNYRGFSFYKITEIRYSHDPSDMWFAEVEFVPSGYCEKCQHEYIGECPEECTECGAE